MSDKPVYRVAAGSSNERLGTMTIDSVQNLMARVGISTPNLMAASGYGFTPITRLGQMLEWMYRGSWIVGAAVDVVAEDMTRAGVTFNSSTPPDDIEAVNATIHDIGLWQGLADGIRWSRLYGGAIVVIQIDGQDYSTPLNPDSISEEAVKGLLVLDRWMLNPSYNELNRDPGPDYGLPIYYDVVTAAPFLPGLRLHCSRVLRFDGVGLPFRQRLAENGWGMSVLERLYDRLVAFDSGTMGSAQLLFKAYLRTYKVKDYTRLMAVGGDRVEGFVRTMEMMRMMQSNEGLTIIDADDELETHSYSFAGIPETLLILGQQISGALGIPLVRLFGQSPAGMNATGDSDIRLYYDMVLATQEARLRRPLNKLFDLVYRSTLGRAPPDEWSFKFNPLWQLTEIEKAEVAQRDADTIKLMHDSGVITTAIALKELKQSSILTGRFTNITDEDIEESEEAPPPWEQPDPSMMSPFGPKPGGAGAPGAAVPGGGTPPKPSASAGDDGDE